MFVINPDHRLTVVTAGQPVAVRSGQTIVSLVDPVEVPATRA